MAKPETLLFIYQPTAPWGPLLFSAPGIGTCLCYCVEEAEERPAAVVSEAWLQRQRVQRNKFLCRNVLGCRWETGSHPRRQSWWKHSWYKYAELIKTGDPCVEWGRWHEWKLFQHCCKNRMWKSCINIYDFLWSHLNRKKVLTPFLNPLRRWTCKPVFWKG